MKPLAERLSTKELIVYVGKLMFDKQLTDISGGNISVRDGNKIYMTPTFAGSHFHWNLDSANIIEGNLTKVDEFKQHPQFSREGLTHLAIYQAFPYVHAVVHAHPIHILPFTANSTPIPPILIGAECFGVLGYHAETPAYSQEQANSIVEALFDQEERMKTMTAGILMPRHGIIVAGIDLITALDSLDRMDLNAYALLAQRCIK